MGRWCGRPVVDGPVVVMVLVVVVVPESRVIVPQVPIAEQAHVDFRFSIIDAVAEHAGSPSHDHGIGKMKIMPACVQAHIGTNRMSVSRAVKRDFNSHGIFGPGGQPGLDSPETERRAVCPRGDSEPR